MYYLNIGTYYMYLSSNVFNFKLLRIQSYSMANEMGTNRKSVG